MSLKHYVEKPLRVDKVGTYSMTISKRWLGSETIISATPVSDSEDLVINFSSIEGNIIFMSLTGKVKSGGVKIHVDYATETRTDCDFMVVIVKECE